MYIEQIDRGTVQLERAPRHDAGGLERRMRQLRRRDAQQGVGIVGLMSAAIAPLAACLKMLAAVVRHARVAPFLAAFVVDRLCETAPIEALG